MNTDWQHTTVCCVRCGDDVAMGSDGQVTLEDTVMKAGARKVRRMHDGAVLAGFAGSSADGLALFTRFESKLQEYAGNLKRAAVELAKEWRTDRTLRHLQALLVVADAELTILVSGNGDVIEPDDGIIAIGSGGPPAIAAARMLCRHTEFAADEVVRCALQAASEIDVYTNDRLHIEALAAGSP